MAEPSAAPPPLDPPRTGPGSLPPLAPAPSRPRRGCLGKLLGCGGLSLGLLLVVFLAVGLAIENGVIPDSLVYQEHEVPAAARELVEEHFGLEPGERLLYLYSGSMFSFAGDGQGVTERRLLSWETVGGELRTWRCRLEEVDLVEAILSDSWLEDSVFHVHPRAGASFVMVFATGEGRDRLVARWLRQHLPAGAYREG